MSESSDYLEMAEEALADSKLEDLSERARWSSLYYSAFYAAKAALLSIGKEPGTHRGTDNLVGKVLYKEEELIDSGTASFYSNLRRIREEIEYEPDAVIHEEIRETTEKVEDFVRKMKEVVESG